MQEDTHDQEEVVKELLMLNSEFALIKRNEITIPDELQASQNDQTLNKMRNMSRATSGVSLEENMMIDVTDYILDQDEDGAQYHHENDIFDTTDDSMTMTLDQAKGSLLQADHIQPTHLLTPTSGTTNQQKRRGIGITSAC